MALELNCRPGKLKFLFFWKKCAIRIKVSFNFSGLQMSSNAILNVSLEVILILCVMANLWTIQTSKLISCKLFTGYANEFRISFFRSYLIFLTKQQRISCSWHQFTNSPIHDFFLSKYYFFIVFSGLKSSNLEGASKCISQHHLNT